MWPESDCPVNHEIALCLWKTFTEDGVPTYGQVPIPLYVSLLGAENTIGNQWEISAQ